MGDLGAYREDVVFNWEAAASLVAELRSLATVLDWQVGERRRIAGGARKHWTGVYGDQFDGRIGICTGDAGQFATSMRDAANKLEELARLAREEQQRREQARAWVEQNDRNWFERNVWDPVFGEDVPEPPPPKDPPRIPIGDPSSGSRGPAVPAPAGGP